MMRPNVATMSHSPRPLPRSFSAPVGRRVATAARATAAARSRAPEPPWLVLPPSPPVNPFSGSPDLHVKGTELPLSIRMVQLKKRRCPAAHDDALGKAISAVVCMISDLQRSAMADRPADEAVLERISQDRLDSLLWLFRRVFFTSPDLVLSLLLLLAEFVAFSAEKMDGTDISVHSPVACAAVGMEVADECAPESVPCFLSWLDIGVKEGQPKFLGEEVSSVDRKRRAYERIIAEGETNSMILSNYAQFLYRIANDHDRAEQYFQLAVMAEPRDAEAMSRYATFLWEERGDMNGAEEMFLEAIETEPWNAHYSSSYACFLWKTGALDTCYPLPLPSLPET